YGWSCHPPLVIDAHGPASARAPKRYRCRTDPGCGGTHPSCWHDGPTSEEIRIVPRPRGRAARVGRRLVRGVRLRDGVELLSERTGGRAGGDPSAVDTGHHAYAHPESITFALADTSVQALPEAFA